MHNAEDDNAWVIRIDMTAALEALGSELLHLYNVPPMRFPQVHQHEPSGKHR